MLFTVSDIAVYPLLVLRLELLRMVLEGRGARYTYGSGSQAEIVPGFSV